MDFSTQNIINNEVYHSLEDSFFLNQTDVKELIDLAKKNPRKRVRYCSHSSASDALHEMFIVHPKDAYVRPHKHLNKIESMLVIDGEVDYVIFDCDGNIESTVEMGDYKSGKSFYQTIRKDQYHTLIVKSEWLVFLEITNGPFDISDTVFADWSPLETERNLVDEFMKKIL